jgi:hypothetical protein
MNQWNPFVRQVRHGVRHQLHQLRIRAARLSSDPRWKKIEASAATQTRALWQWFKSATPSWLAERLGIRQHKPHNRAQSAAAERANRRRAMMYLRRWLHEPLSSERKRAHTNPRRS